MDSRRDDDIVYRDLSAGRRRSPVDRCMGSREVDGRRSDIDCIGLGLDNSHWMGRALIFAEKLLSRLDVDRLLMAAKCTDLRRSMVSTVSI